MLSTIQAKLSKLSHSVHASEKPNGNTVPLDPFKLQVWDHGLVAQELTLRKLVPRNLSGDQINNSLGNIVPKIGPPKKLATGTFSGTQKALTEVYNRSEDR
jgi:hypothetical protein